MRAHFGLKICNGVNLLNCDVCLANKVLDQRVPFGALARTEKSMPDGLAIMDSVIPGAGQGVFALKDLHERTLLGTYDGVLRKRHPGGQYVFGAGEPGARL